MIDGNPILFFCIFGGIIALILLLSRLALKYTFWRKAFSAISLTATCLYTAWRLIFTLNFSTAFSGVFSSILILAEILGIFSSILFIFLFSNLLPKDEAPLWDPSFMPSVDILISTYNETLRLVISTALAAKALPYQNKKVYVCDDGKRQDLKELCNKYGINYLSREDSANGKAGNINHSVSVTDGDFIMLLDADFIVKENIIKNALPYFQDQKVALIQYPQTFYNKDPFQLLSKRFYNEQDFFMRFMEPRLASYNATIHVGTNALIRRTALLEIGGVPTVSVAEDMGTGLLLQNAGYQVLFLNKAYALGIAPFRLEDLQRQRSRWAKGVLQNFVALKPLRMKGLNRTQKLLYLNSLLYWFTSFEKLIYIIMPTLFMVFGVSIVRMNLQQIAYITFPFILLQMFSFHVLVGKVRSFDESHIYDTLVAPFHALAILEELFVVKEKKFHVTPKDINQTKAYNFRAVMPHILLMIWLLFSIGLSIWKLTVGVPYPLGYYVCMFWTLYNIYALVYALVSAKPLKVDSVGEALSVSIDEYLHCDGNLFIADRMSFEGFSIAAPKNNGEFKGEETYHFIVDRTGLKLSAKYVEYKDHHHIFLFDSYTEPDAALRIARFYSQELHAAKVLDFDIDATAYS